MNILTKKNGLALVAVMVLLMILTLLVPAMLTYADTATSIAVKGTDKQKASYLARSGVEMAVAAFKNTYNDGDENIETQYEAIYRRLGGELKEGETPLFELEAETVYLFIDRQEPVETVGPNGETEVFSEEYYNSVYTKDYVAYKNNSRYEYVGKVDVKITRKDDAHVFKLYSNGTSEDICCDSTKAADFAAACDSDVNKPIKASGTNDYSYVKQKYAQYDFTGTAEVNGVKSIRKAYALDTVDTSKSGWLNNATSAVSYVGGLLNIGTTGFDMVSVNPDKASSKQRISYLDGSAGGGTFTSDVLIYSTYGNVIIDSLASYPTRDELNSAQDMQIPEAKYNEMVSTMPLHLGCEPGINYYEKLLKGNLSDTITCTTNRGGSANTFVVFTATNAIQVNLPVNVTVNPIRTDAFETGQGSIYKMMVFQANDIIFKESLVNFASFTYADNSALTGNNSKRFGSVILAATASTPYSYYNISRGKTVRAGKVTFLEDVYLVYIQYGDNSGKTVILSSEVYNNWNEKIYRNKTGIENLKAQYVNVSANEVKHIFPRSSCFGIKSWNPVEGTKYGYYITKLFNKGDVYYFNAEVEATSNSGKKEKVGLNLAGWWVESYYMNNMVSEARAWYQKAIYWAFSFFYDESNLTYKYDDMHYIGNVNEGIAYPTDLSSMCYVIWDS